MLKLVYFLYKHFFRTGRGEWTIPLGASIAWSDYIIIGKKNHRIKWEVRGIVVIIRWVDGSYE